MEDGNNSKPIEMPLRGRPRKRDHDTEPFPHSSIQGYFEEKGLYDPSPPGHAHFLTPQNAPQKLHDPYSRQHGHPSTSVHDDVMDLLGFGRPVGKRDPDGVDEYPNPMRGQPGGNYHEDPGTNIQDYLEPGDTKHMDPRESPTSQRKTSHFCGDRDSRGDSEQKLPDFSSFVNEFRVIPSKSQADSRSGQQPFNGMFSDSFAASPINLSKSPSHLQKDGGDNRHVAARQEQYFGSRHRSGGETIQNASVYSPGRIGTAPGQGFHNDMSPSTGRMPPHPHTLFRNRYPFRDGTPHPPSSRMNMFPSVNTASMYPEGFFRNQPQTLNDQDQGHDIQRMLAGRPGGIQPSGPSQFTGGMDQEERLMASLFPGDAPGFGNPVQQGYLAPDGMGHNASWMNRKKRKNNPLLWQYIKSNQTFHPSIIHPSKYSSLDFIQGVDSSQKMYLGSVKRTPPERNSGNSIFPLFLNSNKEITDEFKDVVQNFRNSVNELDFNNVTVQQLKNLMKEFGLNHTGKKNELIERLQGILKKIDRKEAQKPEDKHTQEKPKESDDFGFYFF